MSQALFVFVVTGIASSLTAESCSTHKDTEYYHIDHYKEFANISNAIDCCHACRRDGPQCGSWKICAYSSGKSCRLLPAGATKSSRSNSKCISGDASKPSPAPSPTPAPPGHCNARDFGAKGDGKTDDTNAINAAIAKCSTVLLSQGTFKSGSVHLRSGLTLTVSEGASLVASSDKSVYDPAEHNEWDEYQDFGHSHFHNSLLWGVGLSYVTINGSGTIDGDGHLTTHGSDVNTPNKMFAFKSCKNVRIEGLTLRQGGWFTLLANDIDGLFLQNMTVRPQRDGFDIISSRHVRVYGIDMQGGGDDAVVLKSDYATGKVLDSYDIIVANSILGCGCNALQFGSETVGNFANILYYNVTVTESGKAGIGIVSMDGSHISNVSYRNITMSRVTTPVYMYIGARSRRPGLSTFVGSISGITLEGITATDIIGHRGNWTATLDGQPADASAGVRSVYMVGPNISFANVRFTYKGGGQASDDSIVPPHPYDKYPPRYLGTRPSYGWYMRNVNGVFLRNVTVGFEEDDDRPAVMVDGECNLVEIDTFSAARGSGAAGYDLGLRKGCGSIKLTNSPGIVTKHMGDWPRVEFV